MLVLELYQKETPTQGAVKFAKFLIPFFTEHLFYETPTLVAVSVYSNCNGVVLEICYGSQISNHKRI